MKKSLISFVWMLGTVLMLSSCSNIVPLQGGSGSGDSSSSAKDIASFYVAGEIGIIDGTNITVAVPFGTNVTALEPTIAITGESVSPASEEAQDFTAPIVYTVTALDNSTKEYTVTVTFAADDDKNITAFSIPSLSVDGVITGTNISVEAPTGSVLTSLAPTIEISAGATVYPASGLSQDFTNPVSYIVVAADGSVKIYTVTVAAALSDNATITAVDPLDIGEIYTVTALVGGEGTIIDVPKNTDSTTFLSMRLAKGEAHQTWNTTHVHDTVISGDYIIVTAQDGVTTATYTVSVQTMAPGDVYQGGQVAYILKSTDAGYVEEETHGIIAANEDGATAAWITGGSTQTTTNGNTLTAIGTGQANTNAMMVQAGYTGGAAQICNDYSSGGYSDWYLPSRDELHKLYINRNALSAIGQGDPNYYWSSSEAESEETPGSLAWYQDFGEGFLQSGYKNGALAIRCVRSF